MSRLKRNSRRNVNHLDVLEQSRSTASPGRLSRKSSNQPDHREPHDDCDEDATSAGCLEPKDQALVETVVDLPLTGGKMQNRPPRGWIADRFDELESRLVAYVLRRIRDADIARDVVQEAFVKLCQQSWPDIEPHAQAWLYKTCRNRAIDITRREGRMTKRHQGTDVATLHDRSRQQPDERLEQHEQLQRVQSQIRDLPERQQEILRLRLHDGLSYKQIAEVTGLTVTNVGYILHQTLHRLRGRLQAEK